MIMDIKHSYIIYTTYYLTILTTSKNIDNK